MFDRLNICFQLMRTRQSIDMYAWKTIESKTEGIAVPYTDRIMQVRQFSIFII